MHSNHNRRFFLAAAASFATVLTANPAFAMTESAARNLIDNVVADINKVIDSGKSDAAILKDLENLFGRYADVDIMAQYALGADGRSASAAQKRAFNKAFRGYITRKYGKRFRDFVGGRIEVQSARAIKSGYEIRTVAYLRGQSPFDVTFNVSDKSGRDQFFNIYIEGVNLLLTERTEIGAMLDKRKGNIDLLIQDLNKAG
jgi:phospholipid transport system substrate-binding protein